MQVLVLADRRFIRQAIAEISGIGGHGTEMLGTASFIADLDFPPSERLVFCESVARVISVLPAQDSDDPSIMKAVSAALERGKTFSLEVVNDNLHSDERAKSTEVRLGMALESMGFKADLSNPQQRVLIERTSALTVLAVLLGRSWKANPFRKANNKERISRSSYKLEEALDYFGIDRQRISASLDVGSAPGGWALLLSSFSKVVAIDPATLDYSRFQGKRTAVMALGDRSSRIAEAKERFPGMEQVDCGSDLAGFDVLHIMGSADEALPCINGMSFDLLTIDASIHAEECAGLAQRFLPCLRQGADLVMTLKLFRKDPIRVAKRAQSMLAGFSEFGLKKLPHDRDELTLHAKKGWPLP